MNSKILVTGGAGYIGSHTAKALIDSGFDVTVIDDLSTGHERLVHAKAKFHHTSVLDTETIIRILQEEKIDGVIHLAAKIIVPDSISNPIEYYKNNTMGVLSMVEACKVAKVKSFVFSSTATIYGNVPNGPIVESTPGAPINSYGFSKLFSEQIIKDCERAFGLKSVILRYFNVAGASSSLELGQLTKKATHLFKVAAEAACGKRASLTIAGTDYDTSDGTGIRDYIHVEDLADVHVLATKYLLAGGKSEIFNCGSGNGASVREVVQAFQKVSGTNFEIKEGHRRPGDPPYLVADSTKVRLALGWSPKRNNLEAICRSAYLFEQSLSEK